jgi:hypothetical protein
MATKTYSMQTSFTGGELSPKLEGRTEIVKYPQSVKTMENFIPLPYGGALKRPGSYFASEVKTSSKKTRLIPFQYSVTQAYILEFGDRYIRFYKDSGQIILGAAAYEIATPYLEADLFELQFTQSADVLFVTHNDYTTNKISRTGHTAWTITAVSVDGGPFMPDNLTVITVAASVTTGVATLTAAAPAWAAALKYKKGDYVTSGSVYKCLQSHLSGVFATDLAAGYWVLDSLVVFKSTHIGSLFKIGGKVGTAPADVQGYVEITAVTSGTLATATVRKTLSTAVATTSWAYGSWSDENGYPACCTFFEQRLMLAGTRAQPQTVWGSYTGEFENFTVGDKDDEALDYTIYSEQVNAIRWMVAGKTLHIGTQGGGFTLDSGSASEPLTPTNVVVLRETTYGSAQLPAKKIANNVYYFQRDYRRLREIAYNFQQDSYVAPDVTIFSDHITKSGIVDMDYHQAPNNLLWCPRADGQVAIMSREIEQEVLGWCRFVTDGAIESVAIIPNGAEDQVWAVVKRTINSVTKRYVEYFKPFDFGDDQSDAFFVDCGLTYNGAPTSSVSGLTHLAGKTVNILTDGAVHPQKIVSAGGVVTLDWTASKIHVGLPYRPVLLLNRPEIGGDPKQSTQSMVKKITNVTVRLFESGSFRLGDETLQDEVSFRTSAMAMTRAVSLFTGDKLIPFPGDYSKESRVKVIQDQPLPLHIEAIILELSVNPR